MKRHPLYFLPSLFVIFIGCASSNINELHREDYHPGSYKTVVVLPFCESYADPYTNTLRTDINNADTTNRVAIEGNKFRDSLHTQPKPVFPVVTIELDKHRMTAPDTLYSEPLRILAPELMNCGLQVFDATQTNTIIQSQQLTIKDRLDKNVCMDLGRIYNVDLIVTGKIALKRFPSKRTGAISIRVYETKQGTEIYSATSMEKDPWAGTDISAYRQRLVAEMAKPLGKFLK